MKHQEDSSDGEDDEEKARNASEAEGIGELEAMAFHLRREDMEEEVVVHHHGSFQIGIRYPGPENGSPNGRI